MIEYMILQAQLLRVVGLDSPQQPRSRVRSLQLGGGNYIGLNHLEVNLK